MLACVPLKMLSGCVYACDYAHDYACDSAKLVFTLCFQFGHELSIKMVIKGVD